MMQHARPSRFDGRLLDDVIGRVAKASRSFLGYPCRDELDYAEVYPLLRHAINNVGDPFGDSAYALNTHALEAEVVEFFAELLHAPKDRVWGYVANGSSEGTLHGLFIARERYPEAKVFLSSATHHGVQKSAHILRLETVVVDAQPSGELDYRDLKHRLFAEHGRPVIIVANIGTPATGAIDDLAQITEAVRAAGVQQLHLHCDAAFGGAIVPFLPDAPVSDFRQPISSIVISGHKFVGCPIQAIW